MSTPFRASFYLFLAFMWPVEWWPTLGIIFCFAFVGASGPETASVESESFDDFRVQNQELQTLNQWLADQNRQLLVQNSKLQSERRKLELNL